MNRETIDVINDYYSRSMVSHFEDSMRYLALMHKMFPPKKVTRLRAFYNNIRWTVISLRRKVGFFIAGYEPGDWD